MKKLSLISIIVPAYNLEGFLHRCVESILNQTYKEIELILVDDGSTDSTGQICDYYQQQDERVKVIHKRNEGVSIARNVALDMARGEYVTFVDGDDMIHMSYVETMVNAAVEGNLDIIQVGMQYLFDKETQDTRKIEKKPSEKKVLYNQKTAIEDLLRLKNFNQSVWGKLFRYEIIKEVRFLPGVMVCEDFDFVVNSFLNANNIAFVDKILYYYYIRRNSVMQTGFNEKWLDEIGIVKNIINKIVIRYEDLLFIGKNRQLLSDFVLLYRIYKSEDFLEKEIFLKEISHEIMSIVKLLNWKKECSFNVKIRIILFCINLRFVIILQDILNIEHKVKQKSIL